MISIFHFRPNFQFHFYGQPPLNQVKLGQNVELFISPVCAAFMQQAMFVCA